MRTKIFGIAAALSFGSTVWGACCCWNYTVIECCYLLTTAPAPIKGRFCGSIPCPDQISWNSVQHNKIASPGQTGRRSLVPANTCTCTFDLYTCNLAGNCVISTAGVTNTGSPSVPNLNDDQCNG